MTLAAAAAMATLGAAAQHADATTYTLKDRNSLVQINPNGGVQDGMYQWTVDGINEIKLQQFWVRIGSGLQQRISALTLSGNPTQLDTNGDGQIDYLKYTYVNAAKTFSVTVTDSLTGGKIGSHTADIGESIKVANTSSGSLDLHLFQFADFDLGGTTGGESGAIKGANTATITKPNLDIVTETVISPHSSAYAVGSTAFGGGPAIEHQLDTTPGLTLNDVASAPINSQVDAVWAFEWDKSLARNGSLVISIDKQVRSIPEPASAFGLAVMGGAFMMRPRRRTL